MTRWTAFLERGTCENPLGAGTTLEPPPLVACLPMLAELSPWWWARSGNETPAWTDGGPVAARELPPVHSLPGTAPASPMQRWCWGGARFLGSPPAIGLSPAVRERRLGIRGGGASTTGVAHPSSGIPLDLLLQQLVPLNSRPPPPSLGLLVLSPRVNKDLPPARPRPRPCPPRPLKKSNEGCRCRSGQSRGRTERLPTIGCCC